MIKKFYDKSTIFMEIRDDATAGRVKRLHDWMLVSFHGISGWTARPQRWAGALGENAGQTGVRSDNMCDTNFDDLRVWESQGTTCTKFNPPMMLHGLCEMPVKYSRTSGVTPA